MLRSQVPSPQPRLAHGAVDLGLVLADEGSEELGVDGGGEAGGGVPEGGDEGELGEVVEGEPAEGGVEQPGEAVEGAEDDPVLLIGWWFFGGVVLGFWGGRGLEREEGWLWRLGG